MREVALVVWQRTDLWNHVCMCERDTHKMARCGCDRVPGRAQTNALRQWTGAWVSTGAAQTKSTNSRREGAAGCQAIP
jgi:hypothetical protein